MTTLLPDSLELSKPVSILHWKENKMSDNLQETEFCQN